LTQANGSIKDLISFARQKLFGGASDELKDDGKIACIAVLTGINVSPVSSIAKELVASHMATCLAVDSGRESLLVTYPCEPVLAEAAKSYIMDEYKKNSLHHVFAPLLNSFRIGAIDRGHNGELVAKILLLLGHFKASRTGLITTSCRDVFDALYGTFPDNLSIIDGNDKFSFNCFTELVADQEFWNDSKAEEELEIFFNRGTAIQLPKCQPGADLLLPIKRTDNDGNVKYKYLLVQVKNYNRNLSPSDLTTFQAKLDTTFETKLNTTSSSDATWASCNIGVSIIMNVGQPMQVLDVVCDGPNKQRIYVVANGIGSTLYPKLFSSNNEPLVESLKKMLREPSVDDWIVNNISGYTTADQSCDFNTFSPISRRSSIHKTTKRKTIN
jgi:hypothetical protein